MASELKVDKFTGVTTAGSILVTGEGNSTTTNLQQGLAKVWISYDGVTNSIVDSFNVASVTDQETGRYQHNYTNSFETSKAYSVAMGSELQSSGKPIDKFQSGTAITGSVNVFPNRATSGDMADTNQTTTTCFGDLA